MATATDNKNVKANDKTQGGKLDGNGNPVVTPPANAPKVQDQDPKANAAEAAAEAAGAKGVSVVKDGKTRVWAELWLDADALECLEILAVDAKQGRRQFASDLANKVMHAELKKLGGEKAEEVKKAREEKAKADEAKKKAAAEKEQKDLEKAKALLVKKGLLPADGPKAEQIDPTELDAFKAWKASQAAKA